MTDAPWQLLPPLSADEYAALKADIGAHGVRVPVVVDAETGEVIDGHHRVHAFEELRSERVRVPNYPRDVRRFQDDEERVAFVIATNLFRRHLTRAQRRELVANLRQQGWSLRRIGEAIGASEPTIRRDLGAIASDDAIALPDRVERQGGGTYPARRPAPSLFVRGRRDEERARAALTALPPDTPLPSNLRRAEELVRRENFDRRRAEAPPPPVVTLGDGIEVRCGDFREALSDIPDASVDAVVCDPPYDNAGIPLYSDLSAFAARVLKPGRLCVAYCGKVDLPEQLGRLGERLEYVWTGAVFLPGRHSEHHGRMIRGRWRPVAIFSAGKYRPRHWLVDAFTSEGNGAKGPTDHRWQQSVGPFVRWVEQVTEPGELVVDPFCGSGTTGLACQATRRRFVGCDLDPASVSLALERLRAADDAQGAAS